MTTQEMIKYLDNPHQLNEYSLSELRALLSKYPYFHTAYALFLLNLKNINDPRYREFLQQSAVYIQDRDRFLRMVHQLDAEAGDEGKGFRQPKSSGQSPAGKPFVTPEATGSAVSENAQGESGGQKTGAASFDQKDRGEETPEAGKGHPAPEGDQAGQGKERTSQQQESSGKPPAREATSVGRKDKDFSTEYLRSRISATLSEQKGAAGDRDQNTPELGSDFFIIDKVSQVEEKMAQRLREKYQQSSKQEEPASQPGASTGQADSFELDNSREADEQAPSETKKEDHEPPREKPEEEHPKNTASDSQEAGSQQSPPGSSSRDKLKAGFRGEYFTEDDYRKYQQTSKQQQNDLIDQFINNVPEMNHISPGNKENRDISQDSVREKDDLASEKLIQVYIQQGYFHKAIEAFEKLSLKYPEKSNYFAEQIKWLRNKINEQEK